MFSLLGVDKLQMPYSIPSENQLSYLLHFIRTDRSWIIGLRSEGLVA